LGSRPPAELPLASENENHRVDLSTPNLRRARRGVKTNLVTARGTYVGPRAMGEALAQACASRASSSLPALLKNHMLARRRLAGAKIACVLAVNGQFSADRTKGRFLPSCLTKAANSVEFNASRAFGAQRRPNHKTQTICGGASHWAWLQVAHSELPTGLGGLGFSFSDRMEQIRILPSRLTSTTHAESVYEDTIPLDSTRCLPEGSCVECLAW
jgi:hypothetical protein